MGMIIPFVEIVPIERMTRESVLVMSMSDKRQTRCLSRSKLESILVTATLITVTFSVGVVFVSVLMVIPR